MARLSVVLAFWLSSAVLAQPTAIESPLPGRGATLPTTSIALIDEAPAINLNPAALSAMRDSQLFYLHERNVARNTVVDSLFLADTWFNTLGVGLALEWIRSNTAPDYRKTSWSLSAGSPSLSMGLAYNVLSSSESADLEGLSSIDLALSSRPLRFLSFGAVVRNVDRPTRGSVRLDREFGFGLGLRPFGERFSLGVDYLFTEAGTPADGQLSYVLKAELLRGVVLGAGVAHGFSGARPLVLQLSLGLNLSTLGLTYGIGGSANGLDHVIAVRASRQKYPAVTLGRGKIAMIDLDDALVGGSSTAATLLGLAQQDPYLKLTRTLLHAAKDPLLEGVVLKIGGLPGAGLGKAEELRQAVLSLRGAGKKVVAVLLRADDAVYHVASAADRIYAVPESTLFINGLAASSTFLGGAMDKLGVQWEVARVGDYKNAPDALTRSDMSPAQREAISAYLTSNAKYLVESAQQGRSLSAGAFQGALAEALLTSRRAQELKLIDEVINPHELDERLSQLIPGARYDPTYRPRDERPTRWGRRPRIAIVPVIGDISGGKSREDPLGLQSIAGAETVVRALKAAEQDPSVRAIVVRVDSPGGDGLASDLMYRAVLEAKKKKPVVASMGDVAASGGYYAAMGADQVFATPTTITGSIGVFLLKPALKGLAEKLGVRQESILQAPNANLLNLYTPWSKAERAIAQKWVDSFYDDFITEVASARKLAKPQVDAVARGRVWSGTDAKARGLVDTLGTLQDAIAAARARAGIDPTADVELTVVGEARGLFAGMGGEPGVASAVLDRVEVPRSEAEPILRLARELNLPSTELLRPGLKAAMEFSLDVR